MTESLSAQTALEIDLAALGSPLPQVEPSYAVLSWHDPSNTLGRQISLFSIPSIYFTSDFLVVFIYSCPSDSPVKLRMLYASGARSTHFAVKTILTSSPVTLNTDARKIETSNPGEITADFLKLELDRGVHDPIIANQSKGFAKPKGPPRRR